MPVRLVGIDPDTGKSGSPTAWVDEDEREILLQGWDPSTKKLAEIHAAGHGPDHDNTIPDDESVIRIPFRMIPVLRKACDDAERSQLR
ncbi:hypothetical protein [Kitasatospora sp. NPDC088351]|uniref:hypothetical protein n=1 Tax=unclassified Kitasatospora TaxID=2633591 RepID=UPI003438EC57